MDIYKKQKCFAISLMDSTKLTLNTLIPIMLCDMAGRGLSKELGLKVLIRHEDV